MAAKQWIDSDMSACTRGASAYTLGMEWPPTNFKEHTAAAASTQFRNYWNADDDCLRNLAHDLVPSSGMSNEFDSSPIHSFGTKAAFRFSNWAFGCDISMYWHVLGTYCKIH